jgi:hypothetical protein
MKMGIHKNTLGYTRMPIKIGIQLARLAEIHQLQDENVVLNRIVPYRIVSYRIVSYRIASLRVYHVYIM